VGGTLQILDGSTPQWQATNAGVLGRDIGHRLKNVAVDGATYPIGHDMRGRITTAPEMDVTYDVHNRLVSAEKNAGWEVYLYDGNGVMVARQDSTGDFEQFAWDGDQMIGSYDTLGSARWEAVFGAGQDELLAFYDYQNGKDLLPVRDWRNNIVSAFDTSSETMMGSASYTAEGRVTTYDNTGSTLCFEEGSGSVCPMPGGLPFAFNGQWRSSLTGLSYMRNRWYSPRLGQFMSHDPLHYVDSVNLYSFAGFDPINSWDPMGLDGTSLAAAAFDYIGQSILNGGTDKQPLIDQYNEAFASNDIIMTFVLPPSMFVEQIVKAVADLPVAGLAVVAQTVALGTAVGMMDGGGAADAASNIVVAGVRVVEGVAVVETVGQGMAGASMKSRQNAYAARKESRMAVAKARAAARGDKGYTRSQTRPTILQRGLQKMDIKE
jgi:RHS repeat-associated protein